jgi:hypothetical protein
MKKISAMDDGRAEDNIRDKIYGQFVDITPRLRASIIDKRFIASWYEGLDTRPKHIVHMGHIVRGYEGIALRDAGVFFLCANSIIKNTRG